MDQDPPITPRTDFAAEIAPPAPSKVSRVIARIVARHPRMIYLAWAIVLLTWAGTLALTWACWWVFIPEVWRQVQGDVLRGLLAALATLFLFVVPVWGWMGASSLTQRVAEATLSEESSAIADARARVRETEEDALNRLESTDQAGLLPLLRYSRAQLEAYYVMGLAQTRRSFVNAAIAMWLGFLILIAGIALYVAPLEQFRIARPSGDFRTMVLASAVIIEAISALFLWVYRSTIGQLTFYYRLQMQSHAAILSFRIANTMDKADEAKRAIIDKLIGSSLAPERPAVGGAKAFGVLLGQG